METRVKHKPKVYVTNFAGHDYSKAEVYGEVVPLTRGNLDFGSLDRVKFYLAEQIAKSHHDDYVALSGSSFIAVAVCILWMTLHGRIKILNYDKLTNSYREFTMGEVANRNLLAEVLASCTDDPYRKDA